MAHSARARAARPPPVQLGSGGLALGNVYDVSSVLGSGAMSAPPVLPPLMPANPRPSASDRCLVACQVGSSVPEKRRPVSPRDITPYWNDARMDQSASRRMPRRMVAPMRRARGAPSSPNISPVCSPMPRRNPSRSHASRSASVGSDRRAGPSFSSLAASLSGIALVGAGSGRGGASSGGRVCARAAPTLTTSASVTSPAARAPPARAATAR